MSDTINDTNERIDPAPGDASERLADGPLDRAAIGEAPRPLDDLPALQRLGAPPFPRGKLPFVGLLASVYDQAADYATALRNSSQNLFQEEASTLSDVKADADDVDS